MRTKLFLCTSLFIVLIMNCGFSQLNEQSVADHKNEIEGYRAAKDQQMVDAASSPLTSEQITNFKGLNYYSIDMSYKVNAQYAANETAGEMSLSTSKGGTLKLKKTGTVTFNLNGESVSLAVFQNSNLPEFGANPNQLFIPFADLSNGKDTYVNGRYLPITLPAEGNTVVLDFNYAMNPYSAMNDQKVSVIPPAGNKIEQIIGSGERKFEDR